MHKEVSLTSLCNVFDPNVHPEAISYQKVSTEIKSEFEFYWCKQREDDCITRQNFCLYFDDVSFSVQSDETFKKILEAFGFSA